ncbi:MAG: FAD-dependent monooxygenase, partial [Actinomycetota bacterium]
MAVGGGPAGLYATMLLKKTHPTWDVRLVEKNPAGATYGWGVVFSDRTLTSFREADYRTFKQITEDFVLWDAIDVRYRDEVIRCEGQPFSGIVRRHLLRILQRRCEEVGVDLSFETEIADDACDDFDLVLAADGVRSVVREAHVEHFRTRRQEGRARYIWYGTTCAYDSFTFAFRTDEHGLFQAHAYPFDGITSTFIVECPEEVWRAAELDRATEVESIAFCEKLFADDLRGHGLMSNNSQWINFVTLRNRTWRHGTRVLLGDAAHTAHFSIGSGTKLAMEDAIALADAFEAHDVERALSDYEAERKPRVERFQEAARRSQAYFEHTRRYLHLEPLQFAFHLLTRSGRIDYNSLRVRDARFVGAVDTWFARRAGAAVSGASVVAPPPALQPAEIGGLRIANRVCVQPPPRYGLAEGVPDGASTEDLARAAATGPGVVLTDLVAVSSAGRITPGCAGLYA